MATMRELTKTDNTRIVEDLKLEFHISTDPEFVARCYRGRKSKPSWSFRFKNEENMEARIAEEIQSAQDELDSKKAYKAEQDKIKDTIKVGDLFCYSWGWEQTNVNFYQVIAKKGKSSLVIREINYETVEECSWGSDYVKPIANSFYKDEEETVRLNGARFKRSCGSANLIAEDKEKHYRSWYS